MFRNFADLLLSLFLFHPWWCIVILLFFAGLFLVMGKKIIHPVSQKVCSILSNLTMGFLVVMVFLVMGILNPAFLGYGYVNNIDEFYFQNGVVVAIDSLVSGSGEAGLTSHYYRIHVIDLKSGKKVFRQLIGPNFQVIGLHDNLLWADQLNEIVGYNLQDGTKAITLNPDQLVKKIPEFASGIEHFEINPQSFILEVTTKDGFEHLVDPLSLQIIQKSQLNVVPGSYIEHPPSIFSLTEGVRKKLIALNGEILNPDLVFLEGKIIGTFDDFKKIMVVSYKTTDKNDFLLSCLSFEGKLLWQLEQKDLYNSKSLFANSEATFTQALPYGNSLIVAVGGSLLSIDVRTGQVEWNTQL